MTKPTLEKAFGYQDDPMNLPVRDVAAAVPFYENVLGFKVVSSDTPHQDGCAFHVTGLEALLAEFNANGLTKDAADPFSIEDHGDASWKVFYVVAPDGLCYWFGERQP